MTQTIIHAHTEHDRIEAVEIILLVGKVDRFDGTAWSIVSGIKIQHDNVSISETAQTDHFHVGIRQLKARRRLTRLQH
jgi:hypothetical protein